MSLIGALDLGGTKVLGGVFEFDRAARTPSPGPRSLPRLVAGRRIATQVADGPDAIIGRMAALMADLAAGVRPEAPRLDAIGVASPGPLDSKTGVVIHAPNLFWHDVPLASQLAALTGVPVFVDNDANLAALAEWAARRLGRRPDDAGDTHPSPDCTGSVSPEPASLGPDPLGPDPLSPDPLGPDPLLYVTVSTGIGGGIISRGEIFRGFRDAAGEIGHITVVRDHEAAGSPAGQALPCNCGNTGCLETVASGTALGRRASLAFGRVLAGADLAGLYASGDPVAVRVVGETAEWLGLGLASVAAIIDPEVIVVGGGVSHLGPPFLDLVRRSMRRRLMPGTWSGRAPRLEPAILGEEAGLVGAALAAWRRKGGAE